MKKEMKVSFIGAGNMGEAMIKGLLAGGFSPRQIMALDAIPERLREICEKYQVRRASGLAEVLKSEVVVIAVKPQSLAGLLGSLKGKIRGRTLLLSIVAGARIATFQRALGAKVRVIRAMPNTPGLIGAGVSAFFASPECGEFDKTAASDILAALGPAFPVSEESLLDAVTGLSGSGPAYVFEMIEALCDAGVMMGLPRPLALALAGHTVAGAARMVIETGEHPAALKGKVASPAGTTIHGLAQLAKGGFRAALMEAVKAATERSRELGK